MANTPSSNLEQLLTVAIESRIVDMHTCYPAKITSFDPESQTCTCEILIKRIIADNQKTETSRSIPPLIDVPLLFMQTADFAITTPVKPGDECLLIFSSRDIDNWNETGRSMEPRTRRKFNLSDAFALPMARSKLNIIENYNPDDIEIRNKSNESKVVLKNNGDILLKNNSKIEIQTPNLVINANIDISGDVNVTGSIEATSDVKAGAISLNSHVHGGVQSGGSNTGGPQ